MDQLPNPGYKLQGSPGDNFKGLKSRDFKKNKIELIG